MKTVNLLIRLTAATTFLFALSTQKVLADHHDGDHASDKGNNVSKAFPKKDGQKDLTTADKPIRRLDSKQRGKKGSGTDSTAASSGNVDPKTIGKGTGNPESTKSGSGTGWSGSGD